MNVPVVQSQCPERIKRVLVNSFKEDTALLETFEIGHMEIWIEEDIQIEEVLLAWIEDHPVGCLKENMAVIDAQKCILAIDGLKVWVWEGDQVKGCTQGIDSPIKGHKIAGLI